MKLILFKKNHETLEMPNVQSVTCGILQPGSICRDEQDLVVTFYTPDDRDAAQESAGLLTAIGARQLCIPYVTAHGYFTAPSGEPAAAYFPYWKIEEKLF